MPFRLRRRLLALLAKLHGVSDALSSQVAAQEYTTEKAPPNLHRPRYARMPLEARVHAHACWKILRSCK